jgi:hypothetical protein
LQEEKNTSDARLTALVLKIATETEEKKKQYQQQKKRSVHRLHAQRFFSSPLFLGEMCQRSL